MPKVPICSMRAYENVLPTITYPSVASRETIRLVLTIASLNGLQVKADGIMNAYVTAPITDNIWTVLGPESGAYAGNKAVIFWVLYGLNSSKRS